jgi:hypothetical protein
MCTITKKACSNGSSIAQALSSSCWNASSTTWGTPSG